MKNFFTLAALLILGGCGFQPLYGASNDGSVSDYLNRVEIKNIPEREGQYLRNALIDGFYKGGRPVATDYILTVSSIRETKRDLDITIESDTTREQLRLDTSITLQDKTTNEIIINRDLYALSSFNVLSNEYATRISENSSRENALDDLARQIELQLALYFKE